MRVRFIHFLAMVGQMLFVAGALPQSTGTARAKGIESIKERAAKGDPEAQYDLGTAYEGGFGVPQDFTKVAFWDRKAAEQGYAKAEADLGVMYELGSGVQQDFVEAAKWFRKAAEQGDPFAQTNLGKAYASGEGL